MNESIIIYENRQQKVIDDAIAYGIENADYELLSYFITVCSFIILALKLFEIIEANRG